MKNPYYEIDNEIVNFLKSKGYGIDYSYGVGRISIVLSQKISDGHLNEFNDVFDYELVLNRVTFDEFGEKSRFEYCCFPPELCKFKSNVMKWLRRQRFPVKFIICSDIIKIDCYEELSNQQIEDFENEFEVKFKKFEISCQLNELKYYFN